MNNIKLSPSQKAQYDQDGSLIIRNFLDPEEVALLYELATNDSALLNNAWDFNDQSGKRTKLTLWFTPGNDTFGLLVRRESMVSTIQALVGEGEVCHFHSKLMQKEPKVGGAWEWHQDYGYWYKNGFLYPDALISVMLALTEATKQNGCLQVLKGSHKMGRFEHNFVGEQQGADMPFVEEALKRCERVYVELNPSHGVQILVTAGLVNEKKIACYEHVKFEVESSGGIFVTPDEAVRDGRIVTGKTWQSHPEFYKIVFECLQPLIKS